jgi:hypothetical protein
MVSKQGHHPPTVDGLHAGAQRNGIPNDEDHQSNDIGNDRRLRTRSPILGPCGKIHSHRNNEDTTMNQRRERMESAHWKGAEHRLHPEVREHVLSPNSQGNKDESELRNSQSRNSQEPWTGHSSEWVGRTIGRERETGQVARHTPGDRCSDTSDTGIVKKRF